MVTYHSARTANRDSLLPKPTLWSFAAALEDDGVALQTTCHVVPCGCDELVFAAEVFDFLLEFGLANESACHCTMLFSKGCVPSPSLLSPSSLLQVVHVMCCWRKVVLVDPASMVSRWMPMCRNIKTGKDKNSIAR